MSMTVAAPQDAGGPRVGRPPPSYSEATRRSGVSLRALASQVQQNLFGVERAPDASTPAARIARRAVPRTLAAYRVARDVGGGGFIADVDLATTTGSASGTTTQHGGEPSVAAAGPPPPTGAARARIGPFATEAAATEAARAFAPPRWRPSDGGGCGLCRHSFAVFRREHHCRNCGLAVCDECCVRWPAAALPESYLATDARSFAKAAALFVEGLASCPSSSSSSFSGETAMSAGAAFAAAEPPTTVTATPTTVTPPPGGGGSGSRRRQLRAEVEQVSSSSPHPAGRSRELTKAWTDASPVRVCKACDDAASNFRQSLLDGLPVLEARARFATGAWANVNFWRPLPKDFALGGFAATHAAVAGGSLPLLQWLVEERLCPVDGYLALTAGAPPKSVVRVAIERTAIDVLQWLLCGSADTTTSGPRAQHGLHALPLQMPRDSGVHVSVAHRALESAVRDLHRLRTLLDQVLADAAAVPEQHSQLAARAVPTVVASAPPLYAASDDTAGSSAAPPPSSGSATSSTEPPKECVICFSDLERTDLCALVPCGHTHVCHQCAGSLATCPICRSHVDRAMRIFVE